MESLGGWWNETVEFWDELELWNQTRVQDDDAKEAVDLYTALDKINATLLTIEAEKRAGRTGENIRERTLTPVMDKVPGLLLAYYGMRISRTLNKRVVKRGLSSSILYLNIGLGAVFFRVVLPRLLAAGSMDDLFDAATIVGIPDRATLTGILDSVKNYDPYTKIGLYAGVFILEKLSMVSEVLPLQIGLKTVSPLIFGGLLPGALGSASCETLGAVCNFLIGKSFLRERLRGFSVFGSQPLGQAEWFGKVEKAAEKDGLRLTLLLRLAPVLPLPFDSYWYILGALPVGIVQFAVGHFLGCLKTAFLDASFGELLLTSVSLEASEVKQQAQQIVLTETAGFAIVAVLIGTVATKLINELLDLDKEEEEPSKAADAVEVPLSTEAGPEPSLAATSDVALRTKEKLTARRVD